MPENKGRKPPHELVDIKFRNGWIVRGVDPAKYRWKPWPEGEHAGDIVMWQKAR